MTPSEPSPERGWWKAEPSRRWVKLELIVFLVCLAGAIIKTLVQGLEYSPGPAYIISTKGPVHQLPPAAVNLARGWQYLGDPRNVGLDDNWAHGGATTLTWSPVTIPNTFNPQLVGSADLGSIGWYRLSFKAPPGSGGRAWEVSFEEVRKVAQVWLNGRYLGEHSGGYVPFSFPATGLRPGAANELVVRVDNRLLPGHVAEDWWNYGGIVRPVSLQPVGRLELSNLGVMPELSCNYSCGSLLVVGTMTNHSNSALSPSVTVRITTPTGAVSASVHGQDTLNPGDSRLVRFHVHVPGPIRLWGPGHPFLYPVSVATRAGARAEQIDHLRVGMRSVQVKSGVLYLNGHRLWLHGASIVDDMLGHGAALTDADTDKIVSELKSLGANITRAHYVLSNYMLDKLDQAGILVWNQPPVYHDDSMLATASGRATELDILRQTIIAARSHASVVVNSVANELTPDPSATPGTLAYLQAAAPLARQLDPSAPVALDIYCYPGYATQPVYTKYDILGINDYYGWYAGHGIHATGKFSELGPFLTQQHQRYPNQALVVSEFGAEAIDNGSSAVKGTFQFQSDYVRSTIDELNTLPFMNGSIYWTLREFAVRTGWLGGLPAGTIVPTSGLTYKALINYAGVEKPAFAETQRLFADPPPFAR